MKAREIIEDKYQKLKNEALTDNESVLHDWAIMDYLDEERERVDGILHDIVDMIYEGSLMDRQSVKYVHDMIDGSAKTEGEKS